MRLKPIYLVLFLTACSPRIIESVRTEVVYRDRLVRDSLCFRDSVFVSEKVKGDTVYLEKISYKYVYRDKMRTDTLVHERRDTTFVEVRVEKPLSASQKFKISAFWYLCAILLVAAIWVFRRRIVSLIRMFL